MLRMAVLTRNWIVSGDAPAGLLRRHRLGYLSCFTREGEVDMPVTLEIRPHMIHAWHLWNAHLEPGHLLTGAPAAQNDGVHFMLRVFRHLTHVPERRLHALVGRSLGL